MFEIKYTDLGGRIGVLETKHGKIETPTLFPVIDIHRQELSIDDIKKAGFNQIITNSYLIYKRYGSKIESIHKLLDFNGVVMTDSGAYQLLQYGDIGVDQETILNYQKQLNVDIGVILDVPTGNSNRIEAMKTVDMTLHRAQKALDVIDPVSDKTIWVLPIQGGRYLGLIEESCRTAVKLPYRMYSIGSPTVFLEKYKYDIIGDMVYTARKMLPWGRPLHLFGAGHPLIIPFMTALGVDTFDSASYILYARDNRIMTDKGAYKLDSLDYMPCNTDICNKFTPRDLLELPINERTRLLALHNLQVLASTIRETKQAIKEGRLWELLLAYSRNHKSTWDIFRKFRKYHGLIEAHTPITIANPKGHRLLGSENFWNPIIVRHLKYLFTQHKSGVKEIKLYPLEYELCGSIGSVGDYIVTPFFGLIPLALCRSYPYSQHAIGSIVEDEVCRKTAMIVETFALKNNINRITIYYPSRIACYDYIYMKISKLRNLKILQVD
ncbi:MAG: tRNA guanosine(15) transglycosylase TgtA [Desulfurococcales archaeon]|nr:tRNA guanosine(15) transglycosylase TgtA [Desulfurococcales archaeon]